MLCDYEFMINVQLHVGYCGVVYLNHVEKQIVEEGVEVD